jgi:hypothetical protein
MDSAKGRKFFDRADTPLHQKLREYPHFAPAAHGSALVPVKAPSTHVIGRLLPLSDYMIGISLGKSHGRYFGLKCPTLQLYRQALPPAIRRSTCHLLEIRNAIFSEL